MCTVTWLMEDNSYTVFSNRDELKTRSQALPPAIKKPNGVRYIAPMDLDGGGTWLGVNEFGLTCGLLNNYDVNVGPRSSFLEDNKEVGVSLSKISRGLLITSLLDSSSQAEMLAKLQTIHLNQFRPFLLTLFSPQHSVVLCTWDGESLCIDENAELPICSSSFDTPNVVQHRQQEFTCLRSNHKLLDSTLLASYHAGHSAKGGAYSVCMHRDDADTVSFSRIRVTPKAIEFCYTPGAPCRTTEHIIIILHRV